MKDTLKTGLKVTRRYTIDEPRTIDFLAGNGDGPARVYATPALIGDIERTCREFLLEHLDPGEDTLGTAVNIEHIAPTLLGMWGRSHCGNIGAQRACPDLCGDRERSGR